MNFVLDLRFVFVLRCLYRQGDGNKKDQKLQKNRGFLGVKRNNKQKLFLVFVNTDVFTIKWG